MAWIETKVCYHKMTENGSKKVTEPYLVDALSISEAEARVTKEMESYISGEFTVSAAKKEKIAEVLSCDSGDFWYKAVLAFITIDEVSGVEKRTNTQVMVQALDFQNALENLLKAMKDSISDFDIVSIAETKIVSVFYAR